MSVTLTKTLQVPEASAGDNYLDSVNPDTQYKTDVTLKVGNTVSNSFRSIYDLEIGSVIDPNVEILSADLVFTVSSSSVTESQTLRAYRLDSTNSGENTSWNAEVWSNKVANVVLWTTAGGDYDASLSTDATYTASQTTVSFNVKELLVDALVNRNNNLRVLIGTTKEFGGDVTGTEQVIFHSSNASTASEAPKLVVRMRFLKNTTYTVSVPCSHRSSADNFHGYFKSDTQGAQDSTFLVGRDESNTWRGALVADLSWIPSSAKVSSATYTIKKSFSYLDGDTSFTIAKLLSTGVTADVSWDYPNSNITATSWTTPGGDFSTTLQTNSTLIQAGFSQDFISSGAATVALVQDAIDNENSILRLIVGITDDLNGSGSTTGHMKFHSSTGVLSKNPTAQVSFMLASTIIDVYLTTEDGDHVVDENGDRLIIGEILVGSPMTDFEDLLEDLVLADIIVGMKLAKTMPPGVNLRRFSISGDSFTGYRVTYNEHIFHGIFSTLETAVGAVAGTYARRGGWLLGSVLTRPSLA